MRIFRLCAPLVFVCGVAALGWAQQDVPRDPPAIVLIEKSILAMGGAAPSDSVATGTITITAGSTSELGTIRILTRGSDQSAEHIQTTEGRKTLIYSRGLASDKDSGKPLQLDLAVTSQSVYLPLQVMGAALGDPETALEYVALENVAGRPLHHIRFWKTYATKPGLRPLAEASKRDLWVDSTNYLPAKLAFVRRSGRGPGALAIPVEVSYSSYRRTGPFFLPAKIETSHNGTPYAVISIDQVTLNSGLTDADFPIRTRRAQ